MGEVQDQFDLLSAWAEGVRDAVCDGAIDTLTLAEAATALGTLTDVIEHVAELVDLVRERGAALKESQKSNRNRKWLAVAGIALLEVEFTGNMLMVAYHLSSRARLGLIEAADDDEA
ncbi:hypothetical protein GCM10022254_50170 [Actinomadura meridiana]|uniref:Uncharacterized protein n=1 Tax=Actinomadura meridiana TaxID=559626 RepID=A0ABP8CD55_9ACTN